MGGSAWKREASVRDPAREEEVSARGAGGGEGEEGELLQKSHRAETSEGANDGLLLWRILQWVLNMKLQHHSRTQGICKEKIFYYILTKKKERTERLWPKRKLRRFEACLKFTIVG